MKKRRIAVVGLSDDAAHAFHSMLKIVEGKATAGWSLASPDQADVLMAGTHATDPVVESWARTDKPLIAVHEGSTTVRRMTPFSLSHPFRVMQLLSLLDDVERSLEDRSGEAPRGSAATQTWAFAESLRRMTRHTATGALHIAHCALGRVYVRDDMSTCHMAAGLLPLLQREHLPLAALEPYSGALPEGLVSRPVFELAWYSGIHGPGELAPWLDAAATYRLRRWPDFGAVRGTREQLALAAQLTRAPAQRGALVQRTGQSLAAIDRFLNACSMAGILSASQEASHAAAAPRPHTAPASRLGGFIRGLRLRLGLTG